MSQTVSFHSCLLFCAASTVRVTAMRLASASPKPTAFAVGGTGHTASDCSLSKWQVLISHFLKTSQSGRKRRPLNLTHVICSLLLWCSSSCSEWLFRSSFCTRFHFLLSVVKQLSISLYLEMTWVFSEGSVYKLFAFSFGCLGKDMITADVHVWIWPHCSLIDAEIPYLVTQNNE